MPVSPVISTEAAAEAARLASSTMRSIAGVSPATHSTSPMRRLAKQRQLAAQPDHLARSLDGLQQALEVERLLQEVLRAQLHRLDGDLDLAVGGDHDHRRAGVLAPDAVEQGQARAVRQVDVQEHDVGLAGIQHLARLGQIAGLEGLVAGIAQRLADERAGGLFVVDDQDGSGHRGVSSSEGEGSRMVNTVPAPA